MQNPLMDIQDCSSSTTLSSSGSSSSSSCSAAAYNHPSSQLNQVVQKNIFKNPTDTYHHNEENTISINCNPSNNLSTWVDSFLSEDYGISDPGQFMGSLGWVEDNVVQHQQQLHEQIGPLPLSVVQNNTLMDHEESSIQLVHVLMKCAEAVQRGEFSLAGSLIKDDLVNLLTRVNTEAGIGKVAGYFIDALSRRLCKPQGLGLSGSVYENEILYHHFYEASPCFKFAHFIANQAILEAFDGFDNVHIIDFNIMQGLQWPTLIQALALRPGGPPTLRLTGIGQPSNDGRDPLRDVGMKLANLARTINVRFAFRGVLASRLDDNIKPWMLKTDPKEVVAVNSIMQLHKLLGSGSSIDTVLGWIHGLNPKVVTVVEQEANHNQQEFLQRFTEALYYYSTMFDSLEGNLNQPEKSLAEVYINREICNVVCCEGSSRVERHEPMSKWRARLSLAGFKQLHLGANALKQANMLLTLCSADGYCVEENDGGLTLGWHSRPLVAASAWQAGQAEATKSST